MPQALAHNPRTQVKAAIKRASAQARAHMNRVDKAVLGDLNRIYRRAADEITATIRNYGDSAGSLRLQILRDLRGQINARLTSMEEARNELLKNSLVRSAELGAGAFISVQVTAQLTQAANEAVRFVRNFVADDGLQLSDRIWRVDNHARTAVGRAVENAVIQGHSASQAATEFLERGEDVPRGIINKINQSNAEQVSRLAANALIRGTGSPRYNALRVFRTELNRAHGEAYMASGEDTEAFGGWRYLLSPNHPAPDICDMHSRVNRYGLGAGVYPDRNRTPWPAHPNTLSYVEYVFRDEVSTADKAGKEDRLDWLKQQPYDVQTSVLGSRKKQYALVNGLLKESQINTPWKVLKRRFEANGHDTSKWSSNIDYTKVPIPPATPVNKTRIKFTPAKTIAEAEKFARDNTLAETVSWKKVDMAVANDWNQSLYAHHLRFPELKQNSKFLGTSQERNRLFKKIHIQKTRERLKLRHPDATDAWLDKWSKKLVKVRRIDGRTWAQSWKQADVGGVSINEKYSKNIDLLKSGLLDSVKTEWHPVGTDTLKSIIDHELGHELDTLLKLRKDDEVISIFKDFLKKGTKSDLSEYARYNIAEFIAESWAEAENNPSPRALASKISNIIYDRYKRFADG